MSEAMFDLLYIMREVCYIILIIMLWFVSVKYLRSEKWIITQKEILKMQFGLF